MKRLPTTLDKLTHEVSRLEAQKALLRKESDRLTRQRKRLEHKARIQQLVQVGQLVADMGFDIADLGALKTLLLPVVPVPEKELMPTTSTVPVDGKDFRP